MLDVLEQPLEGAPVPARVARGARDGVPVAVEGADGDEGVVARAAAQGARARVQGAQRDGAVRGVGPRVEGAVGQGVGGDEVAGLNGGVGAARDEVVPLGGGEVVGGAREEQGDGLEEVVALVTARVEEENRVPGLGEVRRHGPAAGARADDDVVVGCRGVEGLSCGEERVVALLVGGACGGA